MIIDIFNTDRKYNLILADPPWKQAKGGKKLVRANSSGKPLDYQVCTLEEIKGHLQQAAHLARATVRAVKRYFEIPGVQEDYEKWLIEYKKRKAAAV